MKQWFVVHTQARQELVAEQQLIAQGFEVYVPRFKKITRHARKTRETLAPLFPRYIFLNLDLDTARWRSINGTRGVAYVLTHADQPAMIADKIISALKAQENAEGIVPVSSVAVFAAGDKVRVLEGPFKDHTAVFSQLDDKQRVQLLLTFMGRETKISLSPYAVEAA